MSHLIRTALAVGVVGLSLLLCGCGEQTDARVGQWELDFETMEEELRSKPDEGDGAGFAMTLMKSMDFKLHTQPDGTFKATAMMFGDEDEVTGTWTPTPDGMVMENLTKNGKPDPEAKSARVTLIDRDHLRVVDEGGDTEMVFVRADEGDD